MSLPGEHVPVAHRIQVLAQRPAVIRDRELLWVAVGVGVEVAVGVGVEVAVGVGGRDGGRGRGGGRDKVCLGAPFGMWSNREPRSACVVQQGVQQGAREAVNPIVETSSILAQARALGQTD